MEELFIVFIPRVALLPRRQALLASFALLQTTIKTMKKLQVERRGV
jgi:hypothetical protein